MPSDNTGQDGALATAFGLKLYEDGAREKAISIFEMLASNYPDTTEAGKALEMLALPATGKIEIASEPLKMKTYSPENSGEITFRILYVDIEENGIKVTLSIRSANKEKLLYALKNWEDSSVGHIERPTSLMIMGKRLIQNQALMEENKRIST